MPRKSDPLGPNLLGVVEDARADLLFAVLQVREDEHEPAFELPVDVPDLSDEEALHTFRHQITEALSACDRDELGPAERRCGRIQSLATGKGVTSLTTIVAQNLDDERAQEFEQQPDSLCRSIWAFLYERATFEDAESFHFARQFRDHGKLYDAFEVELDDPMILDAGSIDEAALAQRMRQVLELKPEISCTVKAIDLPVTDTHPASIMVIVRHGGPLSSVYDHRNDGRRGTIYYRPPNEATLIYTPSLRQIEVCGDSPAFRQKVSNTFAEIALDQDISEKPLTWKRYNLTRFRTSFRLELPEIDGYEFKFAKVLEAQVRLGTWSRKLQLKVTVDDEIQTIADRYLGTGNIFRRAEAFSRIGIAIAYNRVGDEKQRTLNITVAGTKSCNLQSNKDPDERALGFALLREWGILSAFRQIPHDDLRAMFPQLVQLYDRVDDEVSGGRLLELGLDPLRMIEGGLLERRDRQDVVSPEDDDEDVVVEGTIKPSAQKGMVSTVDRFAQDAGTRPAADVEMYAVNEQWLHETLLHLIKPILSKRSPQIIDPDLTLLGAMQIDGAERPVYVARRLHDAKTAQRLDLHLRARNAAGVGIVLAAGDDNPDHLGANVVVPLLSHLAPATEELLFDRDRLEVAYRNNASLARGGVLPRVVRTSTQSGTLYVPGRDPLHLGGNEQLTIFERLVSAFVKGSPDVPVKTLMDGFGARSPQHAFRKETWDSIRDVYISKGAKKGYWRLLVPGQQTTATAVEVQVEERV